jgi:methyl-accepting chemotaxis protein
MTSQREPSQPSDARHADPAGGESTMSGDRNSPWARPDLVPRRTAGMAMVAIAAFGVVVALVGTVVAWQFVGQLSRSTERSLTLAADALATMDATLDLADELITSLDDGLDGVASSLLSLTEVVDDTTSVAGSTARLAESLAPGLEGVDRALGSLTSIASAADTTLRELSRLPFGPNYDPGAPIDDEIRAVRDDLRPVVTTLRETAAELEVLAESSDEFTLELVALAANVVELRNAVAGSSALIDDYRATVSDSARLAEETRTDLDRDLSRSRFLVVLLGLSFAAGQLVPAWLGRELLIADAQHPVAANPGT